MVARIKVSNALRRNFYYNENKVAEGVAKCLLAANYPIDTERMAQPFRLKMLQKFAALNDKIKTNSVHISLNFDPSEKALTDHKLKEIAIQYMAQIGFGEQPFLVYRHYDAGHPHIHILSVKVDRNGKGIATHNIGKNQSEEARKKIELRFNLLKASETKNPKTELKSAYAGKVIYGKAASKKAISAVLINVIEQYKFSSLAELNAVLHLYNVHADTGKEGSRIQIHHGLLYHILNEKGKPVGVPIKASLFYSKPTLAFLEQKFETNKISKDSLKKPLKNTIDHYFLVHSKPELKTFIKTLNTEGIHVLLRQNEKGNIYGITYIDHRNKSIFNGSDLGKTYSAKMILARCNGTGARSYKPPVEVKDQSLIRKATDPYVAPTNSNPLLDLLTPEFTDNFIPFALKGRKKRKRKIK